MINEWMDVSDSSLEISVAGSAASVTLERKAGLGTRSFPSNVRVWSFTIPKPMAFQPVWRSGFRSLWFRMQSLCSKMHTNPKL